MDGNFVVNQKTRISKIRRDLYHICNESAFRQIKLLQTGTEKLKDALSMASTLQSNLRAMEEIVADSTIFGKDEFEVLSRLKTAYTNVIKTLNDYYITETIPENIDKIRSALDDGDAELLPGVFDAVLSIYLRNKQVLEEAQSNEQSYNRLARQFKEVLPTVSDYIKALSRSLSWNLLILAEKSPDLVSNLFEILFKLAILAPPKLPQQKGSNKKIILPKDSLKLFWEDLESFARKRVADYASELREKQMLSDISGPLDKFDRVLTDLEQCADLVKMLIPSLDKYPQLPANSFPFWVNFVQNYHHSVATEVAALDSLSPAAILQLHHWQESYIGGLSLLQISLGPKTQTTNTGDIIVEPPLDKIMEVHTNSYGEKIRDKYIKIAKGASQRIEEELCTYPDQKIEPFLVSMVDMMQILLEDLRRVQEENVNMIFDTTLTQLNDVIDDVRQSLSTMVRESFNKPEVTEFGLCGVINTGNQLNESLQDLQLKSSEAIQASLDTFSYQIESFNLLSMQTVPFLAWRIFREIAAYIIHCFDDEDSMETVIVTLEDYYSDMKTSMLPNFFKRMNNNLLNLVAAAFIQAMIISSTPQKSNRFKLNKPSESELNQMKIKWVTDVNRYLDMIQDFFSQYMSNKIDQKKLKSTYDIIAHVRETLFESYYDNIARLISDGVKNYNFTQDLVESLIDANINALEEKDRDDLKAICLDPANIKKGLKYRVPVEPPNLTIVYNLFKKERANIDSVPVSIWTNHPWDRCDIVAKALKELTEE